MSKIDDAVFEWAVGDSQNHFMDRNGGDKDKTPVISN